jgi:signal transduction histidine kinase
VRDAVGAFGAEARERVVIEIAPGPHRIGLWDAHLLRRVVTNLVGNALKYSPPDETVTLIVEDGPPGFARLTVRDHGLGMSPEELRTLFQRFARADRARKKAPGLGLGLYAARGIVTAHGGRISVDSDGVDQGAIASVDLPLMPNDPEQ